MKKLLAIFPLLLLVMVILNSGCTTGTVQVTDYNSLVTSLRDAGANVKSKGNISQPFLSVQGRVIGVNSTDVQVFEYPDENAASQESILVSPDGSTVGTTNISWVAPPHFFRARIIIVLYIGEDQSVINLLEGSLGKQFAGR